MTQKLNTPTGCLQALRTFSPEELEAEIKEPKKLLLEQTQYRGKHLDTSWAPFDHINTNARIVIVGITPGRQQMENALRSCHAQMKSGASDKDALREAKTFASFSGPMRTNLVEMLDEIGVSELLGLESTSLLWGQASNVVQFTSALRYPVFVDGKNYSGQPSMLSVPALGAQLERWMGAELRALPNAIYVPLGPKVGDALAWLAPRVGVAEKQILNGLPHPSGASAERIAYWLGRKPRAALSVKTNPEKLDAARTALLSKLASMEV